MPIAHVGDRVRLSVEGVPSRGNAMPIAHVGDRVRLSVEGVVCREDAILIQLDDGVNYAKCNFDVEVIERRKPQVGDTVSGLEAFDALPVGTVVQHQEHAPEVKVSRYDWRRAQDSSGVTYQIYLTRKILYIPNDGKGK